MKNHLVLFASKINTTHIQIVLMLIVLAMLVVGAGAIDDFGGIGRK